MAVGSTQVQVTTSVAAGEATHARSTAAPAVNGEFHRDSGMILVAIKSKQENLFSIPFLLEASVYP